MSLASRYGQASWMQVLYVALVWDGYLWGSRRSQVPRSNSSSSAATEGCKIAFGPEFLALVSG